jgi:hypothetical protein
LPAQFTTIRERIRPAVSTLKLAMLTEFLVFFLSSLRESQDFTSLQTVPHPVLSIID